LDHKIKKAAAENETQWENIGERVELRVWRIEKFCVVPWPKSKWGSFHVGDSYIVLNTYQPDPDNDKLAYDIHFWIGQSSTQDEYGTAAYKTVECDEILDGAAIQHREIQGKESAKFREYFGGNLKYLEGGVESGFNHVEEEEFEVCIYQIKGTRGMIEIKEVALSRDQMNEGDVFLLDTGEIIFQWNGKDASIMEKSVASEHVMKMKASDAGRGDAKHIVLDQGINDASDEQPDFWKHLPEFKSRMLIFKKKLNIRSASQGGLDSDVEGFKTKLYRLSENYSGKLKLKKVADGQKKGGKYKIARQDLEEDDAFIIDTGLQLFIYIGNEASAKEKRKAFHYGNTYCSKYERPALLPVTVVRQGQKSRDLDLWLYEREDAACCVIS